MLYEAVQFQRSELYYDGAYNSINNNINKTNHSPIKTNNSTTVQKVKSSSNVTRFLDKQPQLQAEIQRTGSFVVGQKLRESKWFTHNELKVFCAVIETGFIVQNKCEEDSQDSDSSQNDDHHSVRYGIAVWNIGQEKSKNHELIKIYSIETNSDGIKLIKQYDLLSFWPENTKIRIYNYCDKSSSVNQEHVIREQIIVAETNGKDIQWHDDEHFVYMCRYGQIQLNQRVKNITNAKWGKFSFNAGLAVLKKRMRRMTFHT